MPTGASDTGAEPVVSVVLPTYNRAPLLGRSIRSVLAQSYGDFEVFVIDDGSTDETAGVVADFRDRRIRYVPLPRDTGAAAARNVGIRMSRGKFLAFQDSDDEWLPSKLAKQVSAFERGPAGLGAVYSDMQRVWGDGSTSYLAAPTVRSGRLIGTSVWFYQVCDLASNRPSSGGSGWRRPATSTRRCRPSKTWRCSSASQGSAPFSACGSRS